MVRYYDETNHNVGIVYRVTNLINGKVYIGQTIKNFEDYKNIHIKQAFKPTREKDKRKYFYNALRKYGDVNFKWEIMAVGYSKEELDMVEISFIFINKSFGEDGENFDNKFGYNMTKGGDSVKGLVFTEEHRKKLSDSDKNRVFTKEHCDNLSKASKGVKKSKKACESMSLCRLGKKSSEVTKLKNKMHSLCRCWITYKGENKFIKQNELNSYLTIGWKRGRHKKIFDVDYKKAFELIKFYGLRYGVVSYLYKELDVNRHICEEIVEHYKIGTGVI